MLPATEEILACCERHGAPASLFVDVLALERLRAVGRGSIASAIAAQVRAAVARGHDAQLHLHPHWLAAEYAGGQWRFPADSFRLDAPGMDDAAVAARTRALAESGIAMLREVVGDARYPVVAFRAGGYAIQPRDRAVLRGLAAAGIRIDSSVVPGMRKRTGRQAVDFSRAPPLANWRVSDRGGVLAPAGAGILEIPVAAARLGAAAGLAQWRYFRHAPEAPIGGRGDSQDEAGTSAQRGGLVSRLGRGLDYGLGGWTPLIFPLPAALLARAADAWLDRFAGSAPLAFSALLHPKGFGRAMLTELDRFLEILAPRVAFGRFSTVEAEAFPQAAPLC